MRYLVVICKLLGSISFLAIFATQYVRADCHDNNSVPSTPTITSLLPDSGLIYPAQYYNLEGVPITCTQAVPCTLAEMSAPVFASPKSPMPGFMVWYGTNLCGGLQGPVWWGGNGGNSTNYNCTPALWWWVGGADDNSGVITPYGWAPLGGPTAFLGAGCLTAGVGTITPAKLGGNNNPLTPVEVDDSEVVTKGNSLPFNLIGPDEMEVVSDYWIYCDPPAPYTCNSTVERVTSYQVKNSDGSLAANIPIGEDMTVSGWNCTQAQPKTLADSCTVAKGVLNDGITSDGMGATNSSGEFTDYWTLGRDGYTPKGCGDKIVDHWQLCGLAQVTDEALFQYGSSINWGLTFAGLNGYVYTNAAEQTVSGKNYVLPGSGTCGPDYLLCPDRIPAGTIITPSN